MPADAAAFEGTPDSPQVLFDFTHHQMAASRSSSIWQLALVQLHKGVARFADAYTILTSLLPHMLIRDRP